MENRPGIGGTVFNVVMDESWLPENSVYKDIALSQLRHINRFTKQMRKKHMKWYERIINRIIYKHFSRYINMFMLVQEQSSNRVGVKIKGIIYWYNK